MVVSVTNAQWAVPIDVRGIARVVRCAIRRLRIATPGTLAITFLGGGPMRRLNKRFLCHDRVTDVLSFRYEGERVVGEIFIAPSEARAYAARHRIPSQDELSRYVLHGLLHWLGHDDATPAQQRRMRQLEDELLMACLMKYQAPISKSQTNPKSQIPNRLVLGAWNLVLVWCLEFGTWCFRSDGRPHD